jgi:hypothetical protein
MEAIERFAALVAERDTALLRRCLKLIQCSGVKHPDLIAERDQLERDLRERLEGKS